MLLTNPLCTVLFVYVVRPALPHPPSRMSLLSRGNGRLTNERERCVGGTARVQAWRFFANRIPYEEALLVQFFGGEYIRYQEATPTWLPYID